MAKQQEKEAIKREKQAIRRGKEAKKQLKVNRQVLNKTKIENLNLRSLRYKFLKAQKQHDIDLQKVSSHTH